MNPTWLDRNEYPFAPHWVDVDGGRIHYVDEGSGETILFVHGTPTWSFLYRHLIKALGVHHRCVAPDNLGFGLSDKPVDVDYRPASQARRLAAVIDRLGLRDLTLVLHDFGGPIGLSYAIEHPANVMKIVLFNTWMWSFDGDRRFQWVGRMLGSPLASPLYRWLGLSVRLVWRHAVSRGGAYSRDAHRQYVAAADDPGTRHATWIYAREVLGSSDWYDGLWRRRDRIRKIPALLIWGMKDPAFARFLPRWRTVFDGAEVVELADSGHAPPEERPQSVLPVLARFLQAAPKEIRR